MEYAHGDACKMEGGTLATRLYNRLFLIVVVELKSISSELEVTIFDVAAGTNNSNDVTAVSSHQHFSNLPFAKTSQKRLREFFCVYKSRFQNVDFQKMGLQVEKGKTIFFKKLIFPTNSSS